MRLKFGLQRNMFTAYTKDNKRYIENKDYQGRAFTWDDVPQDANITALTLTHPIPLITDNKKTFSKISITKYHYYYFFNEAIVSVSQSNNEPKQTVNLVAKIIAGVDVEKKYVLEIRLDKYGNTSVNSYPLYALIKKLNNGQMRKSILKQGLACAKENNLL